MKNVAVVAPLLLKRHSSVKRKLQLKLKPLVMLKKSRKPKILRRQQQRLRLWIRQNRKLSRMPE